MSTGCLQTWNAIASSPSSSPSPSSSSSSSSIHQYCINESILHVLMTATTHSHGYGKQTHIWHLYICIKRKCSPIHLRWLMHVWCKYIVLHTYSWWKKSFITCDFSKNPVNNGAWTTNLNWWVYRISGCHQQYINIYTYAIICIYRVCKGPMPTIPPKRRTYLYLFRRSMWSFKPPGTSWVIGTRKDVVIDGRNPACTTWDV